MKGPIRGSCLCGGVRFEIDSEFERFFLCHCERCRKGTGSAHAANLFSTTANIKWISGETDVTVFNLPGTRHTRCFCTRCGSPVPYLEPEHKLLRVPAGCLDSALTMRPDAHIFGASRANWDANLECVPTFDSRPE